MNTASPLARNAVANILQMLLSALALFSLYRYISGSLGVDQLGVWSVVLATVSVSRLADFGLAAGVTRYVARDLANSSPEKAAEVVETAAVSLALLAALILFACYPALALLLSYLFDGDYIQLARDVLPYALFSLWLTIVASVSQGGLDGSQRMVSRATIIVAGQGVLLLFSFLLVPSHGLVGLAVAQVCQSAFLLLTGWITLRNTMRQLPLIPIHFKGSIFREMLGYSSHIQGANLVMLFFDPLTKALMVKYAGPVEAGYFEIANQVVMRVRGLIVAANQAIVPRVVELSVTGGPHVARIYEQNFRALIVVALPLYSVLLGWSELLSYLMVGAYRADFIFFLQVSALGWLVNTFAAPAYFLNMGIGSVSINTFSHVVMGITNALCGFVFGSLYGAPGVIWGYALALVLGSVVLIAVHQRRQSIGWRSVLLVEHLTLASCFIIASYVGIIGFTPLNLKSHSFGYFMAVFFIPLIVALWAFWTHPFRKVMWVRLFRN